MIICVLEGAAPTAGAGGGGGVFSGGGAISAPVFARTRGTGFAPRSLTSSISSAFAESAVTAALAGPRPRATFDEGESSSREIARDLVFGRVVSAVASGAGAAAGAALGIAVAAPRAAITDEGAPAEAGFGACRLFGSARFRAPSSLKERTAPRVATTLLLEGAAAATGAGATGGPSNERTLTFPCAEIIFDFLGAASSERCMAECKVTRLVCRGPSVFLLSPKTSIIKSATSFRRQSRLLRWAMRESSISKAAASPGLPPLSFESAARMILSRSSGQGRLRGSSGTNAARMRSSVEISLEPAKRRSPVNIS